MEAARGTERLVIVSNRLPITVEKRRGRLGFHQSVGGLATGLGSFYKSFNSAWIGWPGVAAEKVEEEREEIRTRLVSDFDCFPVFMNQQDIEQHYDGFCNKTLWPLFHYFPQYTVYNAGLWERYRHVNELFCQEVMEGTAEDDTIWVHDYHLMLLPELIRRKRPHATIGFFLHIPFPSPELFRLLPWRSEILGGLLGADLVGFHTYAYAQHFLDSVHRLLGYDSTLGRITTDERIVQADVFSMGIDYDKFFKAAENVQVATKIAELKNELAKKRVILSVDRLDYSKGIPQRLEAFDHLLEAHPEYLENVVFLLVVVPSRTGVIHYRRLKKQVDELVGRINGKYGTIGWTPVWYWYRFFPFEHLAALYNMADMAFVTPVRDGMNLIAKEYVASRRDQKGVLILSETAGAAEELGEALIVNPNNEGELVEALVKGLTMSEEEQAQRNRAMQKRLQRYSVVWWAEEFLERLAVAKGTQEELNARMLSLEERRKLVRRYQTSVRRLLLLDYDGTLVSFFGSPEEARPGPEVLDLLSTLRRDPRNQVVVVSGRDKDTLEDWFGGLDIGLVAEHGAWVKDSEWKTVVSLAKGWKDSIRPVLDLHVDRTPGSLAEEKEFSLAWHYRKVSPELGQERARELINHLAGLAANLDLQILEGSRVVEVKNAGINKGQAALRWITREEWDFILAIGDDWTDEDLFAVLPEAAYSIRVGQMPSRARFNMSSPGAVVVLLEELAQCAKKG